MLLNKTTGLNPQASYNIRNCKEEDFTSIGAEEQLQNILNTYSSVDYLVCFDVLKNESLIVGNKENKNFEVIIFMKFLN